MALTSRISVLKGVESLEPEDYLYAALGVIFPDDVTNQHGDADHSLVYSSPHLPKQLCLELANPVGETERRLFSHYLWNSSLLLAELIERDTMGTWNAAGDGSGETTLGGGVNFDIRGKSVMELGAGTALPSIMAGLLGAQRLVVTDYPAPAVMKTLQENVARSVQPELSPAGYQMTPKTCIAVHGHSWGHLPASDALCESNRHALDRIFLADCLWMPWQHQNLHKSIDHFLKQGLDARCWVVAGFHTGREKMKGFFDGQALAQAGLRVERIWERDCDAQEREWSPDREEDITMRKRWLVVSELRRIDSST